MAKKEKDCCDIKIKKVKGGYQINVSGKDIEKCLESCLKRFCTEDCCK